MKRQYSPILRMAAKPKTVHFYRYAPFKCLWQLKKPGNSIAMDKERAIPADMLLAYQLLYLFIFSKSD
jgi:hypothetical protein